MSQLCKSHFTRTELLVLTLSHYSVYLFDQTVHTMKHVWSVVSHPIRQQNGPPFLIHLILLKVDLVFFCGMARVRVILFSLSGPRCAASALCGVCGRSVQRVQHPAIRCFMFFSSGSCMGVIVPSASSRSV